MNKKDNALKIPAIHNISPPVNHTLHSLPGDLRLMCSFLFVQRLEQAKKNTSRVKGGDSHSLMKCIYILEVKYGHHTFSFFSPQLPTLEGP